MSEDLGQLDGQEVGVVPAAGTTLTITIKTNRLQTWLVSQVTVECPNAPTGSTCVLRKNGRPVTPLVPNLDAAGGDPPITIRPADELTVTWTGMTAGIRAIVVYFYTLVNP